MHVGNPRDSHFTWPHTMRSFLFFLIAVGGVYAIVCPVAGQEEQSLAQVSVDRQADRPQVGASRKKSGKGDTRIARIFSGQLMPAAGDLQSMQKQIFRLTKRVLPATVGVRVRNAHGSGVLISETGYVLTAAHVAGNPNLPAIITMSDGRSYPGVTLGMELGLDAGLVKLNSPGPWPYLTVADSAKVKEGQWCLATGHPGGFREGRQPVLRLGRVLANQRGEILTDCTLIGGDSGGPLLDMQGRVIGIHSRIGAPLTANLHVPSSVFLSRWEALARGEKHGPYLGVRRPNDSANDDERPAVARVTIDPQSPAGRAGLRSGDIILTFDGQDVTEFDHLRELILLKRPGDTVSLQVRRDKKVMDYHVELGDWQEQVASATAP